MIRSMTRTPNFITDCPTHVDFVVESIRLLRSQTTLWGAVHADGHWAISFPQRDDLLFFRIDRGDCRLLRRGIDALRLACGDVVLVRTSTPITLASASDIDPVDSWALVAATRSTDLQVGSEEGKPVLVRGGRFIFGAGSEQLLASLFSPLTHIGRGTDASDRVCALLAMAEAESLSPGPGNHFVTIRLMELLFAEFLRGDINAMRPTPTGILAGLADPLIARALTALHGDIARPWTMPELARVCGISRSGLSARFTKIVEMPPMTYLCRWRMAVAKDELLKGALSVAQIALLVGFQSGGAFSNAFTRVVGCSPSRFSAEGATMQALPNLKRNASSKYDGKPVQCPVL